MINRLKEIYKYRTMIASLVKRDLIGRYLRSALGVLWNFLNPLLQLFVYTFVFSVVMRNGIEDYYMFLFVGLIPWIFFSTCITGGCTSILGQQDMVKKIYFPREILPISYVLSQLVNMLLCFVVIFAVIAVTGRHVSLKGLITLPVIVLVELLVALGATMILSAATVYFRDLQHIMGIVAMALQFLTPVMYGVEQVPEDIRPIFTMNPMAPVIEAYRTVLYYGEVPRLEALAYTVLMGVVLFLVSWLIFNRAQRGFIEAL